MKPVLIKQPKGLGDIFFCQKIAATYVQRGHRVIWPVISKYFYIKEGLQSNIEYVDVESTFSYKDDYERCGKGQILQTNKCIVVSTDGCKESEETAGVMIGKYKLVDMDHKDWLSYFSFKRDYTKEQELFNLLNINENYVVVNKQIGGPGDESSWQFDIPTSMRQVEIKEYPGYNIFDWSKILENASAFYTMETCISYLIEKLDTKETDYIMYHRSPTLSPNCREFLSIYKKPKRHIGSDQIIRLTL